MQPPIQNCASNLGKVWGKVAYCNWDTLRTNKIWILSAFLSLTDITSISLYWFNSWSSNRDKNLIIAIRKVNYKIKYTQWTIYA